MNISDTTDSLDRSDRSDRFDRSDASSDNTKDNSMEKRNNIMTLQEAIKTLEERSLYASINNYFKVNCTPEQIKEMKAIIYNDNVISLRLLNWFAMKFSANMEGVICSEDKKIKSIYSSDTDNTDLASQIFDIKISYKARLKTHSKKYFDPFRRGNRFVYKYVLLEENIYIETTLCQLNFFRWLFLHNILDYIKNNFDMLKNKMGVYEKNKKNEKNEKSIEKIIPIINQSNYFYREKIVIII